MTLRLNLIAFIVTAAAPLFGCALTTDAVRESIRQNGKGRYIEGVPAVAAPDGDWAAAALESLYRFHGRGVSRETIAQRIRDPETRVSAVALMARDAELNGFEPLVVSASNAFDYVRAGFPALVPASVGAKKSGAPSWLILIAFDDALEAVCLLSGDEIKAMSYGDFRRLCLLNGGGLLVIAPAGGLSASVYGERAAQAEYSGDYQEAARLLGLALSREKDAPVRAGFLRSIGRVELALGDKAAAVQALRNASEIEPQNGDNWRDLALAVFAENGNVSEARLLLERAVSETPARSAVYHAALGDVFSGLGDLPAARAAYEQALRESAPDSAPPELE